MRDRGRESAYRGQPVLHPNLAFQPPELGKVIEGIDVAHDPTLRDDQFRGYDAKGLPILVGSNEPHLPVRGPVFRLGKRVEEKLSHRPAHQLRFGALQQFFHHGIRHGNAAIQAGRDQAVAGGTNNVFVQGLQTFERPARVLQPRVRLTEFVREQAGKVGNRGIPEQVYQNDALQGSQSGMSHRVRRHNLEIPQFEHSRVQNESQAGGEVGPAP